MKIILLSLLTSLSLFSCGQTKSKPQTKEKAKTSLVKQVDTTSISKTPDRLKGIITNIAAINEVQQEHIGFAGTESENYQNFLQLKQIATVDELVALTADTNNTVACYAGWALADKSYLQLPIIFTRFIKSDKSVKTFSGCIQSVDDISSELYHRYWNNVDDKAKAKAPLLLQLDSIILYNDNSYWLLTTRALENRIYPSSYKSRIEDLAFKKGNREALFYLCTWYRADYYDSIKHALIIYLKRTDFSKTGTTDYYRTIDELLKFRDNEIDTLVVQKLKKDKHWKYDEQKFKSLLDDYSIYENFD